MKRFYLLLAAATLLAAIAGCQKEPVGNENAESAKAYAQFTISFANPTGTKTVDADTGSSYDAGTEPEYQVRNATLYFVKDGKVTQVKAVTDPAAFEKHEYAGEITYTSTIQNLDTGDYHVYAVVNHSLVGVTENTTTEAQLQALVQEGGSVPGLGLTNGIPMTSRNVSASNRATAANAKLYDVVTISTSNTKDNPCIISLDMERAWAKITYVAQNATNTYAVNAKVDGVSTKIADVVLESYRVLNQTTNWNAFRQSCSFSTETNASLVAANKGYGVFNANPIFDYLYDPETEKKTVDNVSTMTNVNLTDADFGANVLPTAAEATTLAYVYENGLHKNSQLVGYVTAVQFKGKITPEAVWEKDGAHTVKPYVYSSGDLYFYDNKFYKDLAAVNADANLGLTNDAQAKDFNVKKYTGGVCYYVYYIRHWNNGILPPSTGALGIMEYSIVRNNSYQITVTEINSTGDDEMTESTPTAETPVEQTETYFQVKLTIRPWVVRAQDAILG